VFPDINFVNGGSNTKTPPLTVTPIDVYFRKSFLWSAQSDADACPVSDVMVREGVKMVGVKMVTGLRMVFTTTEGVKKVVPGMMGETETKVDVLDDVSTSEDIFAKFKKRIRRIVNIFF